METETAFTFTAEPAQGLQVRKTKELRMTQPMAGKGSKPVMKTESEKEVKTILSDARGVKALRDELRLQAHLFKQEAKERFDAIEARWRDLEKKAGMLEKESAAAAKEVLGATRNLIEEVKAQYKKFKADNLKN